MAMPKAATLEIVLNGLLDRYKAHVPDVDAILRAMVDEGMIGRPEDVENDHIAFRTLGVPHLGIASLERIFLRYGYTPRDWFDFPAKKVTARWYHPPAESHPRVFISQLRVHELSADAQGIIHRYTDRVVGDPVDAIDLDDGQAVVRFLHEPLWPSPTWAEYGRLRDESEFAAWVIYNRYYLNHFTVSVHGLPEPYDRLERFNAFLEGRGFTLNDAGGTIKTSADGKLLQSSTVAAMADASFPDGLGGLETHRIPGSYVEFAERRVLDPFVGLPRGQVRREHRRDGFEAASADKIFESTYAAQAVRRSEDIVVFEREASVTSSEPFGDVYPSLIYDDAPAAIDWLCRAFGFEQRLVIHGPHDRVEHSELTFGTVVLMVSSPKPEMGRLSPRSLGGVSQALSIYVDDPDAHCRRARLAGAAILKDVQDEEYGARGYLAKDPEGHVWYFGTYRPGSHWSEESPGEPAA